MRRSLVALIILAFVPSSTLAHGGSMVHAPNVEDAHHDPYRPVAGQDVGIYVYLQDDRNVTSVTAIYCRVQSYACAPAMLMTKSAPRIYYGVIEWRTNSDFLAVAKDVGYKFEIKYVDGTNVSTPITHYPARPADLPAEGDIYYYYTLDPAPGSSAPGVVTALMIALVAALWRRRR